MAAPAAPRLALRNLQVDKEIKCFGLAEIPYTIALGAFIGDERHVQVHDFDRDRNTWAWPRTEENLQLRIEQLPAELVKGNGRVAVRVEISASIQAADVAAILGTDVLADIRIRLQGEQTPTVKTTGSAADAQQVRIAMRKGLAAITEFRPSADEVV